MRLIIFSTILNLLSFHLSSQNLDFDKVKNELRASYPEINFSNKLLVISQWNSNELASRENHKEFNRVCKIYKSAKLKGGLNGIIFVSISSDTDEIAYSICLKKDSINTPFLICDFKSFSSNSKLSKLGFTLEIKNVIFDENGNLINKNTETDQIYSKFNSLLTR